MVQLGRLTAVVFLLFLLLRGSWSHPDWRLRRELRCGRSPSAGGSLPLCRPKGQGRRLDEAEQQCDEPTLARSQRLGPGTRRGRPDVLVVLPSTGGHPCKLWGVGLPQANLDGLLQSADLGLQRVHRVSRNRHTRDVDNKNHDKSHNQ